jgi:hypothetical protein
MNDLDATDVVLTAVRTHLRVLTLPTVARECDTMARQALSDGQHPLGFLRSLLEAEMASRAERCRTPPACRPPSGAQDTLAVRLAPRARPRARSHRGPCPLLLDPRRAQRRPRWSRRHQQNTCGHSARYRGHGQNVLFYRDSDLVRTLTEARDARILSRLQDRLRSCVAPAPRRTRLCSLRKGRRRVALRFALGSPRARCTVITSNMAFS